MKFRRMELSRALLAVVYVMYVTLGLGLIFTRGGVSIVQLIFLAVAAITLLAIATTIGNWARVTGLVYGSLLVAIGILALALGIWDAIYDHTGQARVAILGLVLVTFGGWTVEVLRHKSRAEQPT